MAILIITFAADAISENEHAVMFGPNERRIASRYLRNLDDADERYTEAYLIGLDGKVHQTTVKGETTPFDSNDWATHRVTYTSVDSDDTYEMSWSVDGRA